MTHTRVSKTASHAEWKAWKTVIRNNCVYFSRQPSQVCDRGHLRSIDEYEIQKPALIGLCRPLNKAHQRFNGLCCNIDERHDLIRG